MNKPIIDTFTNSSKVTLMTLTDKETNIRVSGSDTSCYKLKKSLSDELEQKVEEKKSNASR